MTEKINLVHYFIDSDIPSQSANMVHVMKMCNAFSKNGQKVVLHCNRTTEINLDDIFHQYGMENIFCIETVCVPKLMRKYGHRLASYYSAWLKTKKILSDGVAYSRSAMSLFFLQNTIPFVYEAHLEPDLINRLIEKVILKKDNCKGVVVISKSLKKRYMELFPFLEEEKIMILHDGADSVIDQCNNQVELKGSSNKMIIGYVGSLFPGKCMETLLPLAKQCANYDFHIVGGNEYWVSLWKEKSQEIGLNNLFFYGYVDNGSLGSFYQAFDICILPFSNNIYIGKNKRVNISQWTSPLKLFEAMAYGKPIIVSKLPTIEEVMEDKKDCLMVEPDNINEWVSKLNEMCNNDSFRKKIGEAAQLKLKKEYTWKIRASKALTLFDR